METGTNGTGDRFAPTELIPPAPARPEPPEVSWRWWEAIIVFIVGSLIGVVLALPGLGVDSKHLQDSVLSLASEVGLGSAVIGWLWFMHRRNIKALGFPDRPLREVRAGVLGGLVIYVGGVFVLGTILTLVLQHASSRIVHSPKQVPSHLTGPEIVLFGIAVILCAPIAEELFFRGLIFKSLRVRHGFWFAGPISALLFAAAHIPGHGAWQNQALLPSVMVFVGFALAYLYERRGNIVANMAAHATFNIIGFIFIVALNR